MTPAAHCWVLIGFTLPQMNLWTSSEWRKTLETFLCNEQGNFKMFVENEQIGLFLIFWNLCIAFSSYAFSMNLGKNYAWI